MNHSPFQKIAGNGWFWSIFCLAFLVLGLVLDHHSGTFELQLERHQLPPTASSKDWREISFVKTPSVAIWERVASSLCYILGISLFVSTVIIKGIEEVRQADQAKIIEKMREKIQEDVFEATMGKFISKEIVSVVKRDVLERALVVLRGRWELDFTPTKDGLHLITRGYYSLLNTREAEVSEEREMRVRPIEQGGLQSLVIRVAGKETLNFDPNAPSPSNVNVVNEKGLYTLTHTITVPPGESAEIFSKYYDTYTLPTADVIFAHYPTQELEILVRFPEDYEIELTSFATSPMECLHCDSTRGEYRFQGALLPGQGVAYSMMKKQAGGCEDPRITTQANAPQ
ncbi:MAG: hypothetical protein QOF24_1295 [Verrucomicrobiota bacterium]